MAEILIALVDSDTGEILEYVQNPKKEPRWMKLWADSCMQIAADQEMRGIPTAVFMAMCARSSWGNNVFITQKEIASDIGVSDRSIRSAIALLEKKRYIQRRERHGLPCYHISPTIMFKGAKEMHQAALRRVA